VTIRGILSLNPSAFRLRNYGRSSNYSLGACAAFTPQRRHPIPKRYRSPRRLNTSPRGHGVTGASTQGNTMKTILAIVIGLPIAAEIITTVMHTVLAPIMRVLGN
jgi:hypothetical protein